MSRSVSMPLSRLSSPQIGIAPVQYARFGDDLALVAARASHKSWWRNFRDPAPVTITLRGRRQRAIAEVQRGDERNAGLSAFRARYPRAARGRLRGCSRPP